MTEKRAKTNEYSEPVKTRRPARRAILEVGRRMLLQGGMDALNLEAVAEKSGLSLEIVHAHFCNTDELVLAVASDELSMLARTATDNNNSEKNSSDEMDILALPKMAESFITARAKSAQEADSKEAGDKTDKRAAAEKSQDRTQIAGPVAENNCAPTAENSDFLKPETLPQDAPRTHRTSEAASEVDGIIRGVAADKPSGENGIPALVARLERRLYVIERKLAEEAGNTSKERTEQPAYTRSEIGQFAERISSLEKQLTVISDGLQTEQKKSAERPPILDATPSAEISVAKDVPGVDLGDSSPTRWTERVSGLLARNANLDTKTLLTRVAPVPIVLAGLVLTTWTAISAGEDLDSTPLDGSIAAPETEIALTTSNTLQPAFSRLEAMMAAADAGDADAQTELGLNYLNGEGVAADTDEALRWLQLASGNGQAVAQYILATIYADSGSTIWDPFAAKFWFQSAAEQGNRMAMNNLAMFYAQGLGTNQDSTEAAHWFAMAAALGFKVAQFNLAVLYERGEGVPQDNVEAYKWYAIAAAQGDADARARAVFLAENMEPDVLLVVQNEVSSFDPAALNPEVNNPPQFDSSTG